MSEEDLKKIEAYFDAEVSFDRAMGLAHSGSQTTAPLVAQLIAAYRRQADQLTQMHDYVVATSDNAIGLAEVAGRLDDPRLRDDYQAVLIWAKLVYRWLTTYFAVPPKFMKDVPAAVIRER